MALDVLSFRALARTSSELEAARTLQSATINQVASQGSGKDLKKVLDPLRKMVSKSKSGSGSASDEQKFIQDFGKGI